MKIHIHRKETLCPKLKEFESIIFSFKEEMSIIEQENIFAIISGDNRPTPQEMYARQKKIAQKYIQYENALWRALGTVEKQKQMLSSAAEKAVDEALEKLADKLNGRGGITIDVDF